MAFSSLIEVPFNKEQVAIAVAPSAYGGGHIGIGFHSAKAGPQVLHLAWHQKLSTEAIPADLKQCWVADALPAPPLASKQIVAVVRTISARSPSINYGINYLAAKGSFANNGAYKAPRGSDGLTCATFVVEVLRACSLNVVKVDTWQPDAANIAWGNEVCNALAATVGQAHADAVRKNVNGLRLIPFEVAGAAQLGPKYWPVEYTLAQQSAPAVAGALATICAA